MIYIQDNQQLMNSIEEISKLDIISLDTETSGLDFFTSNLLLLQVGNLHKQWIIDCRKVDTSPLKSILESKKILGVNLKFDSLFLKHHCNIELEYPIDCFLIEKLFYAGLVHPKSKGYFSMEDMVKKYCKTSIDKTLQDSFHKMKSQDFSREQLEYAKNDIIWNIKIYEKQKDIIKKLNIGKTVDLETKTLPAIVDIEYNGFHLLKDKWIDLSKRKEEELNKKDKELREIFSKVEFDLFGGCYTNFNSNEQLLHAIHKLGYDIPNTLEQTLLTLPKEIGEPIIKYKKLHKAIDSFGENYVDFVHPKTDRIHANINQIGSSTGRVCVSEGTLIECVRDVSQNPKGIPIENIKNNTLVYTYDDNLRLTIRRVKKVLKTGFKKIIRVHWKGTGNHTRGYLDVTPDHKIRLISGDYKQAKDLKPNDKTLSLSRSYSKGYCRLHPTGQKEINREHRFILQQMGNVIPDKYHVHHKDHNKTNNNLDNLEILSPKEHAKKHPLSEESKIIGIEKRLTTYHKNKHKYNIRRGKNAHNWLGLEKEWIEKVLWENGGKPTVFRDVYGIDYETLQKYMKIYKIDFREIRYWFNKNGEYLSKELVLDAARIQNKIKGKDGYSKACRFLKVSESKYKELKTYYEIDHRNIDINNNHIITKIEYINEYRDVYDLVIEDTHNFIANEICVHNSFDKPNTLQIPRDEEYRNCFGCQDDNTVLLVNDYAGQEARIAAELTGQDDWISVINSGEDLHTYIAERLLEKTIDKPTRQIMKNLHFGLIYGAKARKAMMFLQQIGMDADISDGEYIVNKFYTLFPKVKRKLDEISERVLEEGRVDTIGGRPRFFNIDLIKEVDFKEKRRLRSKYIREARNSVIQGTGLDMLKLSLYLIRKRIKKDNLNLKQVHIVHDETVNETHKQDAKEHQKIIQKCMMMSQEYYQESVPAAVDGIISNVWEKA